MKAPTDSNVYPVYIQNGRLCFLQFTTFTPLELDTRQPIDAIEGGYSSLRDEYRLDRIIPQLLDRISVLEQSQLTVIGLAQKVLEDYAEKGVVTEELREKTKELLQQKI